MVEARAGATYQVEPDFAARQSIVWAVAWLVGAAALVFVLNVLLVVPGLSGGLPYLSYGRLHAVADTTLWFGWLGTAAFAATYAILPRIAEAQLHNEVLGSAATLTWSVLLTGGIAAVVFGVNQGRPLGELPVGVDIGLALMFVLVLFNAGVTVVRRRERTLYPSGWYLLAAALTAPVVFVVGNLPFFSGVTDGIVSGFYQNGIEMLWLLPVGLAVAHYVIPVETGNKLHSLAVARAGFWSLMFAGGWAGQRLFLKGPGPAYLGSIAVAMTFVLIVPVLSSAANLLSTGRGRWGLMGQALGLRFAVTGLVLSLGWIGVVAATSVPSVSRYLALTSFQAGIRHLAGFGVFSAFAFALIYHVYPLMVGRDWFSKPLAEFHYWGTLAAVVVGTAASFASGIAQAASSFATDPSRLSEAAQAAVRLEKVFGIAGVVAGAVLAAAQLAFAFNTFRTSRAGPLVRIMQTPSGVGTSV